MPERLLYLASDSFQAARRLPNRPPGDPARRLHGHSFLVRVRADLPESWAVVPGEESRRLAGYLRECVAALDYCDLNEHLPVPGDPHLARWVANRLAVPGIESVGIRSTGVQGADLLGPERVQVWRRFRFEAAHRLPNVPSGHPCGRLHGHGFEVVLHAVLDPSMQEPGIDPGRLERLWTPLQDQLHQSYLNELPGLENPTSELLAAWVWDRIKPFCEALAAVTVLETATAGCHYDGRHYRIWKDLRFEAALRLPGAGAGEPGRCWYGHSYLLRLHLCAPLDEILGWTLDYGDVKRLFEPVYTRLDHRLLNDLPRLADPSPANLVRWVRGAATAALPQLERIDLKETPDSGVVLCWGERELDMACTTAPEPLSCH